jgi:hypothetical protein
MEGCVPDAELKHLLKGQRHTISRLRRFKKGLLYHHPHPYIKFLDASNKVSKETAICIDYTILSDLW